MKVDHLSFSESVERLAAQAGITLRYEEGGYAPGRQQGERTRLVEAHKVAAQFYVEQLDGARGRDRPPVPRRARLRPGRRRALRRRLRPGRLGPPRRASCAAQGFTDKELIALRARPGGRSGSPIDRFRGRLMWPIRDITGEVVGFGARKLRDDDNGPKYLNTPETPIYRKSQVLYGIDLAKRDIAKTSRAVVVEGYTDVMACHLAGVTDRHRHLRHRLRRRPHQDPAAAADGQRASAEVVFTFDGDAAGQKAALRAFEDDQKFAAQTSIAITPRRHGPLRAAARRGRRGRAKAWSSAARRCSSSRCARSSTSTTWTPRRAVRPPLDAGGTRRRAIKDPAIQHEYAVRLAGLLGILDDAVRGAPRRPAGARARDRGGGGPRAGRAAAAPPESGGTRRRRPRAAAPR